MKKNNQTDNKIAPIGQPDITEHNKASNLLPEVLKSLSDINRVILAAPKSGSGKTLITCAIMSALKKRGLKVKGFKCGPDYIDPMFHRKALGIETGNIDSFFTPGDGVRRILEDGSKGYDISVIEGVMGYYDGLGGVSDRASTYEISRETSTPVILVVDAKGAGVSLAATIKGIIDYRTDSNIKGIILNKITPSYYEKIKKLIEEETGVLVLGFMPYDATLTVPDRHLGLVAPEALADVTKWLEIIADYANTYIDLNALIELAKTPAQEVQTTAETEPTAETPIAEINTSYNTQSGKVRIAVARDEAFSFYYTENIRILEKFGAEIIYFSPLHDEKLPADIDCIILWGGYPELYAKDLSANRTMRESIKKAYEKGKLLVAECGGFMYINKSLEDNAENEHEMVGILDGKCYKVLMSPLEIN